MKGWDIGKSLIEDALHILQTCPRLIEALVKFAMAVPNVNLGQGPKVIGARCALNLIEFGQYFFQGLWYTDSSIQQLSIVDTEVMSSLIKKKKKIPKFSSLVKAETRKENIGVLPEEIQDKAELKLSKYPEMEVHVQVGLDLNDAKTSEEKLQSEVPAGNIACVMVILTRKNDTQKDEDFRYLNSNKFPFNEKEKWYILMTDDKNRVIAFDVAVFGKKNYMKKFTFPAFQEGTFNFKLYVRPNGYLELDQEFDLSLTVLPSAQTKYELSKSDLEKMKEPSLFDIMAKGVYQKDENSDEELEDGAEEKEGEEEEEEEEEEEDDKKKSKKAKSGEIPVKKEKSD